MRLMIQALQEGMIARRQHVHVALFCCEDGKKNGHLARAMRRGHNNEIVVVFSDASLLPFMSHMLPSVSSREVSHK